MRLFNTLTRNFEQIPHQDNVIRIYLCGVTVYDKSHIGHARTIVVIDLLNRLLRYAGFKVKFVQNFTDVDDKIIKRAEEEETSAEEIAHKFILRYQKDFNRLNILQAEKYPKATENITEMTSMINKLLTDGHAYITTNGIYFRVNSYPEYGKLSRKPLNDLVAGARVEIDYTKEHPLDFALWKFTSSRPFYPSPWGTGRPGWHIECSAMVEKYLGRPIEIHSGGNDLIFPHHENEIAQSESYSNLPFEKLKAVSDLSRKSLEKFRMALESDLNSSLALKIFLEFVTRLNRIALSNGLSKELATIAGNTYFKIMDLLGLKLVDISESEVQEISAIIVRRDQLRAEQKYRESDEIRSTLMEKYCVELMDRSGSSFWKKVEKCSPYM